MDVGKHTPGPWSCEDSPHKREWSHWIHTEDPSEFVGAISTGPNEEANAHLIAAAPDLLEALQGLLGMGTIAVSSEKDQAHAAIAKALGAAANAPS